jgi:hypothetical protein
VIGLRRRAGGKGLGRVVGLVGLLTLMAILGALALAPSSGSGLRGSEASYAKVKVFFPRGVVGNSCGRVFAVGRSVRRPALLTGAMKALLAGPTKAERKKGYGGWFSAKTARMLRSARIDDGTAYVDFRNFSRLIPNASTSCGSALLLAQLNRTATQFATVDRAVYSFNGSRGAFYNWLQMSAP